MEKRSSNDISWNDMTYDILIKIFTVLTFSDLASVSVVSNYWREASSDTAAGIWKKLDLSRLSLNSMQIPRKPLAWKDEYSSNKMTQFLNNALTLSKGNTSCLIFPFFLYIKDMHLVYAAERSPNLKRLVLPGWGLLSKNAINVAMQLWRGLESITIPSELSCHRDILAAIGRYCKDFKELKLSHLDVEHAEMLFKYTPNLKVLSIRGSMVNLRALSFVLNKLKQLEVVNISHGFLFHHPFGRLLNGERLVLCNDHYWPKVLTASCMKKLITCQRRTCLICNGNPYKLMRTYEDKERRWREDEISSLAH